MILSKMGCMTFSLDDFQCCVKCLVSVCIENVRKINLFELLQCEVGYTCRVQAVDNSTTAVKKCNSFGAVDCIRFDSFFARATNKHNFHDFHNFIEKGHLNSLIKMSGALPANIQSTAGAVPVRNEKGKP